MAEKSDLIADLNWVTEKISAQVWVVNFGTLGTVWALLIASGNTPNTFRLQAADVRWIFVFGIFGFIFELLQHFSGYINARRILHTLEENGRSQFQYDKGALFYRARMFCFYSKVASTLLGAGSLLITMYSRLYG
jgi:hypothetical protein